jgi:hypothetical protein
MAAGYLPTMKILNLISFPLMGRINLPGGRGWGGVPPHLPSDAGVEEVFGVIF